MNQTRCITFIIIILLLFYYNVPPIRSVTESGWSREVRLPVLPTALEGQKLGQCFVDDSRVDAAVGRVPHAPGGAVVVADHTVLADDEPVGCFFLDPVLPVVFSVHHVTALSRLRGRGGRSHGSRRGATGAGAGGHGCGDARGCGGGGGGSGG